MYNKQIYKIKRNTSYKIHMKYVWNIIKNEYVPMKYYRKRKLASKKHDM